MVISYWDAPLIILKNSISKVIYFYFIYLLGKMSQRIAVHTITDSSLFFLKLHFLSICKKLRYLFQMHSYRLQSCKDHNMSNQTVQRQPQAFLPPLAHQSLRRSVQFELVGASQTSCHHMVRGHQVMSFASRNAGKTFVFANSGTCFERVYLCKRGAL